MMSAAADFVVCPAKGALARALAQPGAACL